QNTTCVASASTNPSGAAGPRLVSASRTAACSSRNRLPSTSRARKRIQAAMAAGWTANRPRRRLSAGSGSPALEVVTLPLRRPVQHDLRFARCLQRALELAHQVPRPPAAVRRQLLLCQLRDRLDHARRVPHYLPQLEPVVLVLREVDP